MKKLALFLSPHFDDEVLMGGGTIQVLKKRGWKIVDVAMTMSEESGVTKENVWKSAQMMQEILGIDGIGCADNPRLRDMHLEDSPGELLKEVIKQIRKFEPDIVFTTCSDFHVDHRALSMYVPEAAYQASRMGICGAKKEIKEPLVLRGRVDMEFPVKAKSDVFVEITKKMLKNKVRGIGAFGYLQDAHPATLDIFTEERSVAWCESVARLAGIEAGVKYAEIFEIGNFKPVVDLKRLL
jgi:LmbE family N-acetylglucosaminyl deacetylase